MAHTLVRGQQYVWHHFARPTAADLRTIKKLLPVHDVDAADLVEQTAVSKLVVYPTFLLLNFHLPAHDVAVLCADDLLVTVSVSGKAPLDGLVIKAAKARGASANSLEDTLGEILAATYRDVEERLEAAAREIEALEGRVERPGDEAFIRAVASLRRRLLSLALVLEPQREMLKRFTRLLRSRVLAATHIRVTNVRDDVESLEAVSRHLLELLEGLERSHESFLAHRTNRTVRILTTISVLLMPPTLIASYYGMNVARLPGAHDVRIVSAVIVASVVLFGCFIVGLYRRH